MKPQIFISSVSRELRTARQLVANTLHALGYEPVWQDIFETSPDDLREMLRKKIDTCSAVLQIVGHAGSYPSACSVFATSCRAVRSSRETEEMKMRGFIAAAAR